MFCRDAGMMRRKDLSGAVPLGQEDRHTRHRISTAGSTGGERRQGRMQRQAMRKVMQQAQRLTASSGAAALGSLSPGVCFRATRRSYPDALLVVSDILAEAQVRADAGHVHAARRLDALAAQVALHSGFDELVYLVRAYGDRPQSR